MGRLQDLGGRDRSLCLHLVLRQDHSFLPSALFLPEEALRALSEVLVDVLRILKRVVFIVLNVDLAPALEPGLLKQLDVGGFQRLVHDAILRADQRRREQVSLAGQPPIKLELRVFHIRGRALEVD